MKTQGPMLPGESQTYLRSPTSSSTPATPGTGASVVSLVLNLLLLGHFVLGVTTCSLEQAQTGIWEPRPGTAPLWWEQYQFTWMSVHPECNVPAKCSVTGMDTKEILLLGDSMQRLFLETICETLGGGSEVHASRHYDVPSNCSIDGESHITHQHLLGMSPQPPYFDSAHHDGSNATTRFHNIMHALPCRPDVVVLDSALWDQSRHIILTKATVIIEGQHHYPTLSALQEFAADLESFMTLIDFALPDAKRVFVTTAMPTPVKNAVHKWNSIMLAGFNAVGTSTAAKLGWPVLDAALLQIGFENKQYYIRDSVHPKPEVMQTWWQMLSHHICS